MFQFLRDIRLFSDTESLNGIALKRRQLVLNGLLLTIILLLSVFAIYNQFRGMWQIAALDLCALAACLFAYIRLRLSHRLPRQTPHGDNTQNGHRPDDPQVAQDTDALAHNKQRNGAQLNILNSTSLLVSLILMLFLWALAWQGQAENFSLIWTFFLPVFVFMLNGRALGASLVAVFYLVLFTMAFSQLGQWQAGAWDQVSLIRFVLASLVMVFTCYFSELTLNQAHLELKKSHAESERLLQDRNALMLDTLVKQQKLLTDVSHELRTPLSVLRMKLEAMQDGVMAPSSANIEGLLKHMQQLDAFISDLSRASKLDQTRLDGNAVRVELHDFLSDWINRFQDSVAGRGLQLTLDLTRSHPPCPALLDETSFELALGKLMENSLRYTQAPGSIRLSLCRRGDVIVITLEDSAPGVAADQLERLFEPLYRLEDSRSRDTGGAGLGLSVAKSIILAHQGQIHASLSPLGGLRMVITLPALAD
ncbi:cell wall metabolism sensor histidine kinase WalK [Shewanella amazonensis]|uniref:histidine kinase n=1 Tax=Shewanella amazonensis (strain ATCC BAA-1098 / SB2B) TaxID=326297 RepID=A1S4K4_SHEAM|nr:ATP-binding protein [Shewanella amazonensis]ABL99310.1 signal transduction histidine kinase-like protein [Shewanella amazonensis SB2B]